MDPRRSINTRFWLDEWIETLDPIERLLYLYLLTNPQTNIAGVYEISIKRMAFETGIEKDVVKKVLERFQSAGKVAVVNSHIIVINWLKNQSMNDNMKIGVLKILYNLPENIKKIVKDLKPFQELENAFEGRIRISNDSETISNPSEGLGEIRKKKKERGNKKEESNTLAPSDKIASKQTDSQALKINFDFNTGKWLNIQKEDTAAWSEAYPAADIRIELNKMREWLKANPKKRKSNYRKFITFWLCKEQDRGGSIGANQAAVSSNQITPML
ncbi:MAG: hypothetical protein A2020_16475 [Lentisphaerae bacterium GWF2_45_14]|nr:MAG: hypothetical protein A2020_16475 [Lentisphaerae bacterium GWF2_45_14]